MGVPPGVRISGDGSSSITRAWPPRDDDDDGEKICSGAGLVDVHEDKLTPAQRESQCTAIDITSQCSAAVNRNNARPSSPQGLHIRLTDPGAAILDNPVSAHQ